MKNKIKKINKISNQSGIKKLSLIIKKLNRKTPHKVAGRKVTIDELALMIGKGFRGMDERFVQVNQKFVQINERFNKMENEIVLIKERLDRIEMKLDSLERRIFAIEDILTKHGRDIEEIKRDIKEIKAELKTLKKADSSNSDKIILLEQRVKVLETKIC